jgi:CheY-like chemotaxis protein
MTTRHKVLLVDDDPDLLEMYRGLLVQLPSCPEVKTATSGTRALGMLEDEPYRLLICDLRMPKMDGLQVLSIVRRKYPQLRTVAMTSVADEQFRSRVYSLGVDLFWHKPATEQEIRVFAECLESLLGQDTESGFRGVQSKSLVDIIQLECMSQSSSVLRITNGTINGKIWIQDGEVVDAETEDLRGETAFHKIFSWRAGTFETLPAEPSRPRTIFKSYNGLLLESAQVMDEAQNALQVQPPAPGPSPLTRLSQVDGLEFVIVMKSGNGHEPLARGLEDPERIGNWARQNLERFRKLGDSLQAGPMAAVEGHGPQRQVVLTRHDDTEFCVGWTNTVAPEQIRELMKKVFALWA